MKVKVNKIKDAKVNKIELTTKKPFDDVSVTIKKDTLPAMEHWAYITEDDLVHSLFDAARDYEAGERDNLCIFTEDELNTILVKAGLITTLFDKDSDTSALSLAIIKFCIRFLDVLHGKYDCLKLTTTKPDIKSATKTKRIDPNFDWDDF